MLQFLHDFVHNAGGMTLTAVFFSDLEGVKENGVFSQLQEVGERELGDASLLVKYRIFARKIVVIS